MKELSNLKKGCKLRPTMKGGHEFWYPHITFIKYNTETEATVIFSNGKESHTFNPNGWMRFKVVEEDITLENK